MEQAALTIAALLIVATMWLHSILGQRRLIRPLLDQDVGVIQRSLARHCAFRVAFDQSHWSSPRLDSFRLGLGTRERALHRLGHDGSCIHYCGEVPRLIAQEPSS